MKLSDIRIDDAMQSRAKVNAAVVAEYAEALMEGAKFPPVTVFFDGEHHWLADGFHRAFAYQDAGCKDIEAEVKQGSRREALLHSVGVNTDHGLQRTNADKRKAVMTLLSDAEWSKWSDVEIARRCKVGRTMVRDARPSPAVTAGEEPAERTYITKHGTVATMDTSRMGKAKPANTPPAEPTEPEPELDAMGQPMANWIKKEPRYDEDDARDGVAALVEENQALTERLAVAAMDATPEERVAAADLIAELRARVVTLEAENDALKSSRDSYLVENAELKQQCQSLLRKLKRAGALAA